MSRVHLSAPDTGELEEKLVLDALRSGWVAPLGSHVDAFEAEMARRLDVEHAVALSSGTAALHLALVSWGVGPGDVVPMPTMTFAATANAVVYTGATPLFVDSEQDAGTIDVDLLAETLHRLTTAGTPVPAIIPVDLLGVCADYAAIAEVADRYGVRVLCDAAESLGAQRDGLRAGGFGDAAVLSFNGNKVMTTSGGGMLTTGDQRLASHVRHLSAQAREPVPHYEHHEIGYNYRLSNVLAAIGRAQLSRLDEMIARRSDLRRRYAEAIEDIPGVRLLGERTDRFSNAWLTALVLDPETCPIRPGQLGDALAAADIESRPVWKPMHLQPVHRSRPTQLSGVAERLFATSLTLPSGSALTEEQIRRVLDVLHTTLSA